MKCIKIVLVGCGEHSQENIIPSLKAIDNIIVTRLYDNCQSHLEVAKRWFPEAEATHSRNEDEIVLDNCEAVVVVGTPQLHYKLAKKCVEKKIPIFVEKPPTTTTRELESLVRLAEKNNVVTMVGHNLRHSILANEFQRTIKQADFGKPIAMEMRYYASKPRGHRWGLNPIKSFLLSHVNHAIDLMVYHMGEIDKTVVAKAWPDIKGGVAITVQFIFKSGAIGNLLATSYAPFFTVSHSVLSDKGVLAETNGLRDIKISGEHGFGKRWANSWQPRTLESGYTATGYQDELQNFFLAIATGVHRNVHPSFSDELEIYKAIDIIEKEVDLVAISQSEL